MIGRCAAGTLLIVYATHALGVVPIPSELCASVVCSGYKWLLATHMGILGWNRRRSQPSSPMMWVALR